MSVTLNVIRKSAEIFWDADNSESPNVVIYAQGSDGKWHNTTEIQNDGKGELSYPADFVGDSLIEIRVGNEVIDSGTISIT